MPTQNALYTILTEKIKQGALVLPSIPQVALKVQQAAEDPDINLQDLTKVLSQDPVLSARLIKVANCAMFARAVNVETLNQAVNRIGLRRIRDISIAMALEQLFRSKNKVVADHLQYHWHRTVKITSVALALMPYYLAKNKLTKLRLETMMLAALMHNIGTLPILSEAERHPNAFANPSFLSTVIKSLGNNIGQLVMKEWLFASDFIKSISQWNQLTYFPKNTDYIDFIRIGAIYSGVFTDHDHNESLLAEYVKKGILPHDQYLSSDEFKSSYEDIKTMFA